MSTIEVTLILISRSHASRSSFVASPIAPPTPTGPGFSGLFCNRAGTLTDIDQDAHATKELDGLRHRLSARLFLHYIRLYNLRDSAFAIDHVFRPLSPFHIVVDQGNFGALPSKEDSCCAAVANFTFETSVETFRLSSIDGWTYQAFASQRQRLWRLRQRNRKL